VKPVWALELASANVSVIVAFAVNAQLKVAAAVNTKYVDCFMMFLRFFMVVI
jgi:hypothetical protein